MSSDVPGNKPNENQPVNTELQSGGTKEEIDAKKDADNKKIAISNEAVTDNKEGQNDDPQVKSTGKAATDTSEVVTDLGMENLKIGEKTNTSKKEGSVGTGNEGGLSETGKGKLMVSKEYREQRNRWGARRSDRKSSTEDEKGEGDGAVKLEKRAKGERSAQTRISFEQRRLEQRKRWEEEQAKKEVLETGVKGKVKWYSLRYRYGFIERENLGDDVFVHQSAILKSRMVKYYLRTLGEGEPVVFDVVKGHKGPEAANVTGPNGTEVRGSPYFRMQFYRYRRLMGPNRQRYYNRYNRGAGRGEGFEDVNDGRDEQDAPGNNRGERRQRKGVENEQEGQRRNRAWRTTRYVRGRRSNAKEHETDDEKGAGDGKQLTTKKGAVNSDHGDNAKSGIERKSDEQGNVKKAEPEVDVEKPPKVVASQS